MAQWRLNFIVGVNRVADVYSSGNKASQDANAIIRAFSRVEPRPMRSLFDDGCVKMSYLVEAASQSEAHQQQCRIQDALVQALDAAGDELRRYAIEFDAPQLVESGAGGK
jgi:hypothetical protein